MSLYLKNAESKEMVDADEKVRILSKKLQEARMILRQLKFSVMETEILDCKLKAIDFLESYC